LANRVSGTNVAIIWASTHEPFNGLEADEMAAAGRIRGCLHVSNGDWYSTVTP